MEIALGYLYGIGDSLARDILTKAKISFDKKAKDLSESEQNAIRDLVGKHKIEGDLRREIASNIKRLKEIKTYRGTRHSKKIAVQRTEDKNQFQNVERKCPHHNGQWKKESGKDIKLWETKKS